MKDADFGRLLTYCQEISQAYPGVVYIGGIAVYLHATNLPEVQPYAEFTHDADFYISLADMGDLRDQEELTPNRRLSKHQLIKGGFEFDIYTERQSGLIVPYADVAASAVAYGDIRVASLETLMILKLEAYRDRQHSTKGAKDAKDMLRLALIAEALGQGFQAQSVAAYLHDDHLALLGKVERGSEVAAMAMGNAVIAKRIRQCFGRLATAVRSAYEGVSPELSEPLLGERKLPDSPPRPRRG